MQRAQDLVFDLATEARFHLLLDHLEVLRPRPGGVGIVVPFVSPFIIGRQVEFDGYHEKLNRICGRVVSRMKKAAEETARAEEFSALPRDTRTIDDEGDRLRVSSRPLLRHFAILVVGDPQPRQVDEREAL